ncbi:MAG: hypothetical protein HY692_05125, partial [Cyanobacteria bacterium NC_groundwater_1444_Ag_S-0.65um_54_12]|nr:hypothetical protein [Cyanobacteria bacterium NC_groundwater_1444_Ag_S-0.65um_54_12]
RIRQVTMATGIITTIAGIGTYGYSGVGGPALNAMFGFGPASAGVEGGGICSDSVGNLYIADSWNHRVRKVDTSGIITTIAGNGNPDSLELGDGGPATAASLMDPRDVAVDNGGNIYIADQKSHRIRKVDTAGIITTVAGGNSNWGGYSGDGGPAVSADLYYPESIAVDGAGNLYIADNGNNRIRKVDTNGIITTVAGDGGYYFSGDGGPATAAGLARPRDVAMDGAGNLYIADSGNNRIRKVDTSGIITTLAGDGSGVYPGDGFPATAVGVAQPRHIAVDGTGNLYIAEWLNNRLRKVDASGIITTLAGTDTPWFSGDGGPVSVAELAGPGSMTVDGAGNLFFVDSLNGRIRWIH